jgi:hypothetical protein
LIQLQAVVTLRLWQGVRIEERQLRPGDIGCSVAAQIELHRLIAPEQPEAACHPSFDGVVDFTTNDAFVRSPSHRVKKRANEGLFASGSVARRMPPAFRVETTAGASPDGSMDSFALSISLFPASLALLF